MGNPLLPGNPVAVPELHLRPRRVAVIDDVEAAPEGADGVVRFQRPLLVEVQRIERCGVVALPDIHDRPVATDIGTRHVDALTTGKDDRRALGDRELLRGQVVAGPDLQLRTVSRVATWVVEAKPGLRIQDRAVRLWDPLQTPKRSREKSPMVFGGALREQLGLPKSPFA